MKPVKVRDTQYHEMRAKRLSDIAEAPRGRTTTQNKTIAMSYSRPLYLHKCPMCGGSFEGIKTAITCGPACRKRRQRLTQGQA